MRITKKPDERRKEILDTAMALFIEKGYENTAVEDITNTLQIAKGSFYYYFKTKQDVFEACISSAANEIVNRYLEILNNSEKSVVKRLVEYIEYNFALSQQGQKSDIFAAIHSPTYDAIHSRVTAESTHKLLETFTQLIKTGIEECEFGIGDPEFTAAALLGALNGAHDLLSKRKGDSPDKQRRLIYDLMQKILGVEIKPHA